MAVTDYDSLKTAATTWVERTGDTAYTGEIDTFIDLWESVVNRKCRHPNMEAVSTVTTNSSGVGSLPADFASYKSAYWDGSVRTELEPITKAQLSQLNPAGVSGVPCFIAVYGSSLELSPIGEGDVILSYYAKIAALASGNTTNWLITLAPDAYLFGTVAMGHIFNENFEKGAIWQARAEAILAEIGVLGDLARFGNAGQVFSGVTP